MEKYNNLCAVLMFVLTMWSVREFVSRIEKQPILKISFPILLVLYDNLDLHPQEIYQ